MGIQHYPSPIGWLWDDGSSFSEKLLRGHTLPCKVLRRLSWNSINHMPTLHMAMVGAQEAPLAVIIRTSCGTAVQRALMDKGSEMCKGKVTEP